LKLLLLLLLLLLVAALFPRTKFVFFLLFLLFGEEFAGLGGARVLFGGIYRLPYTRKQHFFSISTLQ
jgi:hypothetical protein